MVKPGTVRRLRLVPAILPAACVLAVAAQAASFRGPPGDHSLCCGRGYNPLVHGADDPTAVRPPGAAPGSAAGTVAAANASDRRVPASVRAALDAARPAASAGPASTPSAPPNASSNALPGPPLAALEGPLETISGYASIAYSQLAGFKFRPPPQPHASDQPPPDVLGQVPAAIRQLDGRKIVLTGFMLPLKLEKGLATEFFFLSSPTACCYGIMPDPNEWMFVKMRDEGLPAIQDVPMFLAGRLHVRARWDEGYLIGIYDLEGHGLLKPR